MMAKQATSILTPMKVASNEVGRDRAASKSPVSDLTVIILTYNEAHHIGRAIDSVMSLATDVFVIDSGSTDATVDVAKAKGAKVLHNPWVSHATQFQWGLDNAPIKTNWVMRLDADEVIEPDLKRNILNSLGELPETVCGIRLKRKHIFMGRWIRHGGRYPVTLLRIWRRGCAHVEDRWMDEHVVLDTGTAVTLNGSFSDINLGDLSFFTSKHNRYATLEAVEFLNHKYKLFNRADEVASKQLDSARLKRVIKGMVYNRLPFGFGPVLYFIYRYILRFGFLDGREGFIYHCLQALWYRYLVAAKIFEMDRQIAPLADNASRLGRLSELTSLDLKPGKTNL